MPPRRQATKLPAPPQGQPPPLQSLLPQSINEQALLTPVVANTFAQLSVNVAGSGGGIVNMSPNPVPVGGSSSGTITLLADVQRDVVTTVSPGM